MYLRVTVALLAALPAGCSRSGEGVSATAEPQQVARPSAAPGAKPLSVHGKAITEPGAVTLADVARDPNTFATKTFVVKGTVSAVCEHRGCWMELGDAGSSAHLRMSGHAFFVPRDSAGKQARVEARLVADPNAPMCDEAKEKTGCTAEAEKSLGRPLAKLQLEALGVEIYPAM